MRAKRIIKNSHSKTMIESLICILGILLTTETAKAQQLHFERTTIDTGTLTEDDSATTYHFPYKNLSKEPVTITKAETTCGCTRPTYKHTAIAPGEEGEICITFYPLGRVGEMRRSVYFNTEKNGISDRFKLTLTGNVLPSSDPYIDYPYAIGPLRLMQSAVNFRKVKGTQKKMICIQVVNAGSQPLKLSTLGLPPYISFMSNPTTISPNKEADLMFVISPGKCKSKGKVDGEFFLNGVGDINPLQRTMNYSAIIE